MFHAAHLSAERKIYVPKLKMLLSVSFRKWARVIKYVITESLNVFLSKQCFRRTRS